jgi:hypothetical protein
MDTGAAEFLLDRGGSSGFKARGDRPGDPNWIEAGKVDSTGVVNCEGSRANGEVMEAMGGRGEGESARPYSATEGKGVLVEPGLNPMIRVVLLLLGESMPGEPSRSELSLGIRCGTIRPNRGEDGPAAGK